MITPMRKPISSTTGTPLAPASVAMSSTSPQLMRPPRVNACLNSTLTDKVRHLRQVRDLLHRGATHFLEDPRAWAAAGRCAEIFRRKLLNQHREVRSEIENLDFSARRAIAMHEIEKKRDAHVVGVLDLGCVDDDRTVRVACQRLER